MVVPELSEIQTRLQINNFTEFKCVKWERNNHSVWSDSSCSLFFFSLSHFSHDHAAKWSSLFSTLFSCLYFSHLFKKKNFSKFIEFNNLAKQLVGLCLERNYHILECLRPECRSLYMYMFVCFIKRADMFMYLGLWSW